MLCSSSSPYPLVHTSIAGAVVMVIRLGQDRIPIFDRLSSSRFCISDFVAAEATAAIVRFITTSF